MRKWVRMPIRTALLVALLVTSSAPLLAYWFWSYHQAISADMDGVEDKHLLIARNIAVALDRYHVNLLSTSDAFAPAYAKSREDPALITLMRNLNMRYACLVEGDTGRVIRADPGGRPGCPQRYDADQMDMFALIAGSGEAPHLSGVMVDKTWGPCLRLIRKVGDDFVVAAIATDYIHDIARRNRFGVEGHTAIFDQTGRLLAHPRRDWELEARDVSTLPPVRHALAGKEGVEQFFSPAFGAEMVAGVAPVSGPGWGVMAPQPMEELRARARDLTDIAFVAAMTGVVFSVVLALLFARWISRPINRVAGAARRLADGEASTRLAKSDLDQPMIELSDLSRSFNRMGDQIAAAHAEEKRLRMEAEMAAEGKSVFLANVSHEIRTPLNGILGVAELLRNTRVDARQSFLLDQIAKSGKGLSRLLNDVLDSARIETGRLTVARTPFDLRALVDDVARSAEADIGERDLTLQVDYPDAAPDAAIGDKARVRQVLSNLTREAIERTPTGAVTIAIDRLAGAPRRIRIAIIDPSPMAGGQFRTAMSNTPLRGGRSGEGLTDEELAGVSLGGAMSKTMVAAMGGQIGVDDTPGGGATFWFTVEEDPGD